MAGAAASVSLDSMAPRGKVETKITSTLFNWNLTEATQPATVVKASSIEDVQRVCRDRAQFPSPVLAVGAMHSVNACLTNNGGTLVNMSALNRLLGLEEGGVRVQAGVKMADLYDWLGEHDLETSFCPEIGDATVGSLAVTTSKDSSIDGPGYLSALVTEVKFVDEEGRLMTLTRSRNPAELAAFTCSYGMMGVVVEVVVEVRPRIPVSTRGFTKGVKSGAAAVRAVLSARANCDALFAILVPDRDYVYLEARRKAKGMVAAFAANRALGAVATVGENEICRSVMVKTKYKCFLKGQPPGRKLSKLFNHNIFEVVHFRNMFTNRYPEIQPGTKRLDFSYFEFDLPSFSAVLEGCWDFHNAFKATTGFAPRGYGIYFVNRGYTPDTPSSKTPAAAAAATTKSSTSQPAPGHTTPAAAAAAAAAQGKVLMVADIVGRVVIAPKQQRQQQQQEGVLPKPYGNYSKWGPGVSFMMDPITDEADNPLWAAFNQAYITWAVSMGGTPSLSQTKGLQPGQATLPAHLTRERFLTPYYKSFVA